MAKRADSNADILNQYVEARLAETGQQSEIAVNIYQDALKAQPDNIQIAGKAYVQAIETGNWDLAVKAVRTIDRNGKMEPEMPLVLFADAFKRRDRRSIEVALLKLESLNNFAFMAPMLKNWVSIAQGNSQDISFDQINENRTSKFYIQDQQILGYLAARDLEKARTLLRQAIDQNQVRMAPVRMLAARHFIAENDLDFAREILGRKRTAPELLLLNQLNGNTAKNSGQKLTEDIGASFTLQRISADLGAQRAPFLALLGAQVASRINGDFDFSNLVLGRAFLGAKKGANGRETLKRIEENSPYYLIALNAEIGSYLDEGKFDAAASRIQGELDQNSNVPELHILLGQTYQGSDDHEKAVPAYAKAIEIAEGLQYSNAILANYHLALGSAQEQAGIWPEGLQSLKKANELLPNSANILNYLGYAQLERRVNKDEAIAAIRQAHKLRSTSAAITDSLGWAYFLIGDHDQAVKYLEKALAGQPQDPTINEHLGDAYWTVGRKFEARYAWNSAKLFADNGALDRLSKKIDLGLKPELISP